MNRNPFLHHKIPLYSGLFMFVLSVLVWGSVMGQKTYVSYRSAQATVEAASLVLRYTEPDLVSVEVQSNAPISNLHTTLRYDPAVLAFPDSALAGSVFTLQDETAEDGEISFVAIPTKESVSSGIVATFRITRINQSQSSDVVFVQNEENTAVFSRKTGQNVLRAAEPLTLSAY